MVKNTVDIKVSPDLEAKVRQQINEALSDTQMLQEVGEIAKKQIQASIIGAREPATGKPFAARNITPEWQKRKKRLSTVNKAFDSASGGGSSLARLIFTGQWIQSFKVTVTGVRKKQIEIGPSGTHEPYMGIRGKPIGEAIENETLGRYLIEQGRNWFGFPPNTTTKIVQAVKAHLRRKLTK